MKNALIISTFIFLTILISACEDMSGEIEFQELIYNGSVEEGDRTPFRWFTNLSDYRHEWSDSVAFKGNRSLMLTSDVNDGSFGQWWYPFSENIPHGKKVRLKCQIKLDNITGEGVSIDFRGDDSSQNEVFSYTTKDVTQIKGSGDWKEYSVEMDEVIPEKVTLIFVHLILQDNSEGTVYFDEISLKAF